jgi:hypothetical protein
MASECTDFTTKAETSPSDLASSIPRVLELASHGLGQVATDILQPCADGLASGRDFSPGRSNRNQSIHTTPVAEETTSGW